MFKYHECGDCFYNGGADKNGVCHCERTGIVIEPMMKACVDFWFNPDFEEEEEE